MDAKPLKAEDSESSKNTSIETEFWNSVKHENVTKVITLIDRVDVNYKNSEEKEQTPLHVAVSRGNKILVALLLGRGADVSVRDTDGRSVLGLALDIGDKELINLLAEKTVSSLEDVKQQLSDDPHKHRAKQRFKRMKELFTKNSKKSAIEADTYELDADVVKTKLSEIFEPTKTKSIFQAHFPRKSAITSMLTISHFQTIYNMFVSGFLISLVNTFVANYIDDGQPLQFDVLFYTFDKFPHAILFWCLLFTASHSIFFLQKGIVLGILSPKIAYSIYIGITAFGTCFLPYWIRTLYDYPPATSAFVICEAVRLWMKMHSYLVVNRAMRIAKENGEDDPWVKEYPKNVTLWNYFEFLWLPTLVYQTSYPRTATRRWGFIVRRFGEVLLCIIYLYAVWERYVQPTLPDLMEGSSKLALGVFKVMMPGIAVSLLGFFMVLHSWLNAFAELTKFADRHFYSDWWNSTDWAMYYRKWNYIVHHFIHRHVFMECIITMGMSKPTAMGITFLLSSIIHEYVLAVSLGFWKPIMLLMFLVPGVLFIPLTRFFKGNRLWNVFMWSMLIIGHGMLLGLYARAWHMHYHVRQPVNWYNYIWIL